MAGAVQTAAKLTGSKRGETTCETSGEVREASERGVLGASGHGHLDLAHQNGGNDQTVNTQNTCHNHWHDVLHHLRRVHDTHGRDTNTGLGGAVRSAQVCREDKAFGEEKNVVVDALTREALVASGGDELKRLTCKDQSGSDTHETEEGSCKTEKAWTEMRER